MPRKQPDPNDTYVVREMFGCGEGHFLTPGFTHWEQGEVCPHGHESDQPNEYYHLYYRKFLVPTLTSKGEPIDEYHDRNPGKWGQLPLAEGGK